jgi:methionyl-tRNA formyltransferase
MNILVVTDNLIQYSRIREVVQRKNLENVNFVFKCSAAKSPMSDHRDFKNGGILDVHQSVEYIVSNFQLVISAHCLQLFPKELVSKVRCINIHPGYNPINRGWYPQIFSIIHDLPIGATIHEMDEQLDHGAIIARRFADKYIWDTSLSIYERILQIEIELFSENFESIIYNTYKTITPEEEGNLFLKKDFKNLCLIDLNKEGSFLEFYNLLRALSHSSHKNAYFIDPVSGKKIFLKLEVEHDQTIT